jgi:ferritin-like metal-binding protein YciE
MEQTNRDSVYESHTAATWEEDVATDAKEIYATALRNTHAMEQQGLQQMETQVSELERYPEYRALLQRHIETTRGQLSRLERALEAIGESRSSLKEAVTSVAGRVGAAVHAIAQDETLKNLYAGYAFQHEQIAAYRSLAVIAEKGGGSAFVSSIRQAIAEEEEAAQAAAALIEPVTRKYVELTAAGAKADA